MGLFDTIECDYPLPNPCHQGLRFQTKDFDCFLEEYSMTRDGRLIKHARGGPLEEGGRAAIERDVELPVHGDIRMYDVDPVADHGLIEYVVRFTHGRVEWIQPWAGTTPPREEAEAESRPQTTGMNSSPTPDAMGRPLTAEEFSAQTPEKLELIGGRIPGDRGLLLLLLTSFGLRRAAALVGYAVWKKGLLEQDDPATSTRP